MIDLEFKGETGRSYGVFMTTRPSIPAPQPRGEYVEIVGRDGSLLVSDGTYADIQIDVAMNFVQKPDKVGMQYRRVKSWLSGSGKLKFSDDLEAFYKVKTAAITENERPAKTGQKISASFICDPYTYMESGTAPIGAGTFVNPFMLAKPIYTISGTGNCSITVNGEDFPVSVSSSVTIDSNLMLAYRGNAMQNTATEKDFDILWLPNGENTVTITDGFTLSIIPNWRTL